MRLDTKTEQALIADALEGDSRAFSRLASPHMDVLFRVCRRATSNDSLAMEAAQESLTLVWERLSKLREGVSFRSFLLGIATKKASSVRRSEKRIKARELLAQKSDTPASPEQLEDAKALEAQMDSFLTTLPKKRRQALILRMDGDLSYKEIATQLKSSERSVRVLVHMALKELRSHLALAGFGSPKKAGTA